MIPIFTYSLYILISVFVTVYVGYKLHKDGGVWILSIVKDDTIGVRLNNLLLMGYYLVNIGFIFYTLATPMTLETFTQAIQVVGKKLGIILLILAYLHYQNIILIYIYFTFKHQKKWKI
ncbi:MAG: hypothetical protein ACRCVT_00080 [Leadbetterella sp.]